MYVDTTDYFEIAHNSVTSFHQQTLNQIHDLVEGLCKAGNVYALCLRRDKGTFAAYLGDDESKRVIRNTVSNDDIRELLDRFEDYDIENVISVDTGVPNLRLTGLGIRQDDGYLIGVGILIAFIPVSERDLLSPSLETTDEDTFNNTVELYHSMIRHFFHEKLYALSLEEKMEEVAKTGEKLEQQLTKNEVLTNILKKLESDNDFAKITEDVLRDTSEYLKLSNAFLIRENPDGDTIDLICEWSDHYAISYSSSFITMKKSEFPFFNGKTYTISSETVLPEDFEVFFDRYGMTAAVFLPLTISGRAGMYLGFDMQGQPRRWDVDELKFLSDVKRVLQSILVKRITKNSLASSYSALESILENAGCGICVDDNETREILLVNDTFKEMFSDDEDMKAFEQVLLQTNVDSDIIDDYRAVNVNKWYEITFSGFKWVDGRDVRLTTIYDVTSIKDYQKQIEHQSNVDYLTGLRNRRRLENDLREEIRFAVRAAKDGTLLYFDLDDFKNINDGLGHKFGDLLLKEVSDSLMALEYENVKYYRLGGDEFGILIPYERQGDLERIIESVDRIFSSAWRLDEAECYCTMSMSSVTFPKDGVEVDLLLQRADIALAHAKSLGKNRLEAYNKDVTSNSGRRLDVERALREAVADGCKEFEVYYQPLVNVSEPGAACCGAEALVRWNSSELGFMRPDEFIPLAEYLGLIVPIGEHVLIQACHRCKYWNDFGHPEFKVNVNLSVVQLLQKNIIETVENAIKVTGINPSNLTLEVTEGLAINDIDSMQNILNSIKKLGVRVALDDFGTGYSSLSHIRNMPLDVIKIDKCFINDVGKDNFSDAFVKTVSRLADALELNVCVEGVETVDQKNALDAMNVDIIQGYLYDKPLTQSEFENKYLI